MDCVIALPVPDWMNIHWDELHVYRSNEIQWIYTVRSRNKYTRNTMNKRCRAIIQNLIKVQPHFWKVDLVHDYCRFVAKCIIIACIYYTGSCNDGVRPEIYLDYPFNYAHDSYGIRLTSFLLRNERDVNRCVTRNLLLMSCWGLWQWAFSNVFLRLMIVFACEKVRIRRNIG